MSTTSTLGWRLATLKNGIQDATAYRIEFLFEVLGSAVVPAVIQWMLWYAAFHLSGATSVAGMSYSELVQYTLASILFSQVRGGDQDFELAEMIRSGGLSNYLLRPVSVIEFVWLRGFGGKIVIAGFALAAGVITGVIMGWPAERMVGAMLLAIVGNIIHFQLSAALAAVAFLWEEAYSILMVKNLFVSLLSGELIPLSLIPASYSWVWKSTPFYLYVYGPSQYALGKWSNAEFFNQFGIALIWLVAGWVLIRATWGTGIRRYQGLGG